MAAQNAVPETPQGSTTSAADAAPAADAARDPLTFDDIRTDVVDTPTDGAEPKVDAPSDEAPADASGGDAGDPGDENDAETKQATTAARSPEDEAERKSLLEAIAATAPGETKTEAKAPAADAKTTQSKADAEKAATGAAEQTTPAFEAIDPEAVVKTFADEFGEEAGKAVAPIAKAVKQLTEYATRLEQQRAVAEQYGHQLRLHAEFDRATDDCPGLATVIGDGRKGQFTPEHLTAREQLREAAATWVRQQNAKGVQVSAEDAIRRVAPLIFDNVTRASAADSVRATLERRHKGRSIKPTGSRPQPQPEHQPDVSWGDESDTYLSKVKQELAQEGF